MNDPGKKKLEHAITHAFLPEYNLRLARRFVVIGQGIPPEPDLICADHLTGAKIGIEVTAAYYDAKHAEWFWAPARGKETEEYLITEPDSKMNRKVLAAIDQRIQEKAKKYYESPGPLLLVIFTSPPRFYLHHQKRRLETLLLPTSYPFDEIYIVSQNWEVYRLHPNRGLMS